MWAARHGIVPREGRFVDCQILQTLIPPDNAPLAAKNAPPLVPGGSASGLEFYWQAAGAVDV